MLNLHLLNKTIMKNRIISIAAAFLTAAVAVSCGGGNRSESRGVISVSIAPIKYFTEAIAGDDFEVNVMVPAGSDPHFYEPSMAQVQNLSKSLAYISIGYLDFEVAWLYKFYQVNPEMKIISFANNQELLYASAWEHGDHMHYEGVDPHFWVSPKSAYRMAADIKDLLLAINPSGAVKYEENYTKLISQISEIDREAGEMLAPWGGRKFMIYHPVLGYFARDYGLEQVAIEHEGKEPSPSALRELIDLARANEIKTIFVQQEFDRKNAEVIAAEVGAQVITIDPLSPDWQGAVRAIASALAGSFSGR